MKEARGSARPVAWTIVGSRRCEGRVTDIGTGSAAVLGVWDLLVADLRSSPWWRRSRLCTLQAILRFPSQHTGMCNDYAIMT